MSTRNHSFFKRDTRFVSPKFAGRRPTFAGLQQPKLRSESRRPSVGGKKVLGFSSTFSISRVFALAWRES
jgi:hypothetical protein